MWAKLLAGSLAAAASGYAVVSAMAYGGADNLIFQPRHSSYESTSLPGLFYINVANDTTEASEAASCGAWKALWQDLTLHGASCADHADVASVRLAAVFLPAVNDERDKPKLARHDISAEQQPLTLLYLHGNAEDLGNVVPRLRVFAALGFNVLAYDYRGYGLSTGGAPTECSVCADVLQVYDYMISSLNIAPENVIVYGRSVGGGPATYLAAHRPVGGLVLESTFVSAVRVVLPVNILPFDKFPSHRWLQRCTGPAAPRVLPVLVIHGDADGTVPFEHGQALYQTVGHSAKQFLWVRGGSHNGLDAEAGPHLLAALKRFAQLVRHPQSTELHDIGLEVRAMS